MGYNARNDEIRDNVTRMRREWEAQRGALATVRRFNAIMSSKGHAWFWPTIAAALVSKHHWLVINRDSCGFAISPSVQPSVCNCPIRAPTRTLASGSFSAKPSGRRRAELNSVAAPARRGAKQRLRRRQLL